MRDRWKVASYPSEDTEEMCLEISDFYLCCVASVASGGNEFHLHLVLLSYYYLCGFGHFVIEDMFLWDYAGSFEAEH